MCARKVLWDARSLSRHLVSILVTLSAASIARDGRANGPKADGPKALPFSISVATKPLEMLRGNLDYPVAHVVVNGEVWLIFVPGTKAYGDVCPVYRYKGPISST